MMQFSAKDKPRWYQLRWRLSNFFVSIARKIKPDNPEVMAFMAECIYEHAIMGKAVVLVKHQDQIPAECFHEC